MYLSPHWNLHKLHLKQRNYCIPKRIMSTWRDLRLCGGLCAWCTWFRRGKRCHSVSIPENGGVISWSEKGRAPRPFPLRQNYVSVYFLTVWVVCSRCGNNPSQSVDHCLFYVLKGKYFCHVLSVSVSLFLNYHLKPTATHRIWLHSIPDNSWRNVWRGGLVHNINIAASAIQWRRVRFFFLWDNWSWHAVQLWHCSQLFCPHS